MKSANDWSHVLAEILEQAPQEKRPPVTVFISVSEHLTVSIIGQDGKQEPVKFDNPSRKAILAFFAFKSKGEWVPRKMAQSQIYGAEGGKLFDLHTSRLKAQLWFFPEVISTMQTLWQAHLPGNLSLSPLDGHTLIARVLLLLPVAPLLALLDEWIDPRTRVHLQRVLTPADLREPSQSADPPPPSNASTSNPTPPSVAPPADTQEAPVRPPQKTKRFTTRQTRTPQPSQVSSDTGHVIIESVLAPDQTQAKKSAASRSKEMQKIVKNQKMEKPQPKTPPVVKPMNWDDVLE